MDWEEIIKRRVLDPGSHNTVCWHNHPRNKLWNSISFLWRRLSGRYNILIHGRIFTLHKPLKAIIWKHIYWKYLKNYYKFWRQCGEKMMIGIRNHPNFEFAYDGCDWRIIFSDQHWTVSPPSVQKQAILRFATPTLSSQWWQAENTDSKLLSLV